KLWSPFLLMALPAMFVTGSLALLFETLPVLRGGVGNVIYFFVWTFGLAAGADSSFDDPAGIGILQISTRQAMERMNPGASKNSAFSLTIGGEHASRTFLWNGIEWTLHIVAWRLLWVAVGFGVALLASVFFHRFDPARESIKGKKVKEKSKNTAVDDLSLTVEPAQPKLGYAALTPLGPRGHSRFAGLVLSELSLMVKGLRWWWYAVAAGLLVAEFVSPTPAGPRRRAARGLDLANLAVVADGLPRVALRYAVFDFFGGECALSAVGRVMDRRNCGGTGDWRGHGATAAGQFGLAGGGGLVRGRVVHPEFGARAWGVERFQ